MSRGSMGSALKAARPASSARAKARAMRGGIAGLGHGRVEQHRVVAELHRLRGVRGHAEPGIDHQRDVGEAGAQGLAGRTRC